MPRKTLTADQIAEGKRLAESLKGARRALDREQAELARRSGVSVDMIRRLEKNRVPTPSFAIVARLARDLEVKLDALAEETLQLPATPTDGR